MFNNTKVIMKSMFQLIASLACVAALTACGAPASTTKTEDVAPQPVYLKTELAAGSGAEVVANDLVQVSYSTFLYDSTKPNSRGAQVDGSPSAVYAIGTGRWLPGAEVGVLGMRKGGTVLAYGVYSYTNPAYTAKVGANTPLVMEITVLGITKPSPSAQVTIIDKVVGTGAEVSATKTLTAHYTGWIYDATAADQHGVKFDSSVDKNVPLEFTIAGNVVIEGWKRGLVGMKVGGKRTLIIPPELGYGFDAQTAIPAGSTLIFDIELLSVK
jgi:peptidylprolyl isomerase